MITNIPSKERKRGKKQGRKVSRKKGCAYGTHTRTTSAGRALRFSPFFTPFARFFERLTDFHSVCIVGSQNAFSEGLGDKKPKSPGK